MVRAIIDGSKTQTRRVVNPEPSAGVRVSPFCASGLEDGHGRELRSPYGKPGDRLWVRESLAATRDAAGIIFDWHYAADGAKVPRMPGLRREFNDAMAFAHLVRKAVPSIHMPRWASRITLEVTGVRVERLHDITEADAAAEGVESLRNEGEYWKDYLRSTAQCDELVCLNARDSFWTLWDSLNAARGFGWDASPWVWVVEFKRIEA
jgi:hypothetical protein